ncbi:MAG: hypothetical protein V4544_03440 [Pseudomonadota bacterium]
MFLKLSIFITIFTSLNTLYASQSYKGTAQNEYSSYEQTERMKANFAAMSPEKQAELRAYMNSNSTLNKAASVTQRRKAEEEQHNKLNERSDIILDESDKLIEGYKPHKSNKQAREYDDFLNERAAAIALANKKEEMKANLAAMSPEKRAEFQTLQESENNAVTSSGKEDLILNSEDSVPNK